MGQFDGLPKTTSLKLNKPGYDNVADILALNENADILDSKIAEILNAIIIASQNEAELGNDNAKMMTPLRTKQAVEKFAPLKTVNGQKPNVSGDVEILDLTPVGDVVYRPYLRAGYVKANGATVKRSEYSKLVEFANTNNLWTSTPASEPWKYGRGNGSTTMVLPDYRNRFIQGGDSSSVKAAGLPNIVGSFYNDSNAGVLTIEGAFSYEMRNFPALSSNAKNDAGSVILDASRCSAIYGASSTVQPPALMLIPQLRY